ncbi:MAG: mucoidy inhibitor MuiA family protein [Phycisphaerales bacterium]
MTIQLPARRLGLAALLATAAIAPIAAAQVPGAGPTPRAEIPVIELHELPDPGAIESVTVYPGRAAVTRAIRRELGQGVWTIRVPNLPASVQPASLQARVGRGGDSAGKTAPKLLGVEYSQNERARFEGTPEGVALQERVESLTRALEELVQDRALLAAQAKIAAAIGVRPTASGGPDGAVQPLDLEAAAKQLEFVRAEKLRLLAAGRELDDKERTLRHDLEAAKAQLAARGGADRTERAALVSIAVPEGGPVEVELTYLVGDAGWEPSYAVRAEADRSGVSVEYDALIAQRTGEDWNGVRMSLSTAQPTRASAPPPVDPWYVDIVQPMPPVTSGTAGMIAPEAAPAAPMAMADASSGAPEPRGNAAVRRALEELSAPAAVQETGVAVSFDLPRAVTVPSDARAKQRTRIGAFAPSSKYVYVAAPLVTESVFLRGDMTNESAFQLLPGKAQIFMGGEFVGESRMPSVAPKDTFRIFFGPDQAVVVRREELGRTTGASGLFGGSRSTIWKNRIALENGTGRAIALELYDRRPVSRDEKIEVRTSDLAPALSTDKQYLESRAPQGILRWDLALPATAKASSPTVVGWTIEVSRPNDVRVNPPLD